MINQINDTISLGIVFVSLPLVDACGWTIVVSACRRPARSNFVLTIGYRDRATLGSRVLVVI
jgi:hypothetical protein